MHSVLLSMLLHRTGPQFRQGNRGLRVEGLVGLREDKLLRPLPTPTAEDCHRHWQSSFA